MLIYQKRLSKSKTQIAFPGRTHRRTAQTSEPIIAINDDDFIAICSDFNSRLALDTTSLNCLYSQVLLISNTSARAQRIMNHDGSIVGCFYDVDDESKAQG